MVFKPTPLELTEFVNEFLRCGGDEGGRTPYLNAASVALYQLSYAPNQGKRLQKQKYISAF